MKVCPLRSILNSEADRDKDQALLGLRVGPRDEETESSHKSMDGLGQ